MALHRFKRYQPDERPPNEFSEELLDEMDQILSANAGLAENYHQRGGQGWSMFFDPQFFIGAIVAGLAAGITIESIKAIIARVAGTRGDANIDAYDEEGNYSEGFEHRIAASLRAAVSVLDGRSPVQGTIDEATAFHWALLFVEMRKESAQVLLPKDVFAKLVAICNERDEVSSPGELVRDAVEKWLADHELQDADHESKDTESA